MTTHADLLDPSTVAMHAKVLDDLEGIRKAQSNRYGKLTGFTPDGKPWKDDKDGQERSFGLARDNPHVTRFADIIEAMSTVEDQAVKNLEKAVRVHPLGPWIKRQKGLGDKQVGRLLAVIGDPFWRDERVYRNDEGDIIKTLPEGPRTVSALWAYSGLHVLPGDQGPDDAQNVIVAGAQQAGGDLGLCGTDAPGTSAGVAARRRKGVKANWSTEAKTRAYLCATSCLKQLARTCEAGDAEGRWVALHHADCACSPYRVKYDVRRMRTTDSRPDWTDGHRHNDALRVASKEILKQLWIEARRLHCAFDPEMAAALTLAES